jgi:hypothetical protein
VDACAKACGLELNFNQDPELEVLRLHCGLNYNQNPWFALWMDTLGLEDHEVLRLIDYLDSVIRSEHILNQL